MATGMFYLTDLIPLSKLLLILSRSRSPAPTYDNQGRRINTREYRYRKRLEEERHKLIQKANVVFVNYHAPADYRRPAKMIEKVYVPVNDYPEINFSKLTLIPLVLAFAGQAICHMFVLNFH